MREVIENFTSWIELVENVIHNDVACPSSFEKKFCHNEELIAVWFSSERMKVDFLASSGQHVSTTYSLQELSDWLESEDDFEEGTLND